MTIQPPPKINNAPGNSVDETMLRESGEGLVASHAVNKGSRGTVVPLKPAEQAPGAVVSPSHLRRLRNRPSWLLLNAGSARIRNAPCEGATEAEISRREEAEHHHSRPPSGRPRIRGAARC